MRLKDNESDRLRAWQDFQQFTNVGGMEIEEDKPISKGDRISFGYYVSGPAILFGALAGCAAFGVSIALAESVTWLGLGGALSIGALVALIVAIWQIYDWRTMQWKYERRSYPVNKKETQPERGRVMTPTGPNTYTVQRCTWVTDWKRRMARRTHNQYGEWVGPSHITRRLLEKMKYDPVNLITNPTRNFDDAKKDLKDNGIIGPNLAFTESGKRQLHDALGIITSVDRDRFPTIDYKGPIVW